MKLSRFTQKKLQLSLAIVSRKSNKNMIFMGQQTKQNNIWGGGDKSSPYILLFSKDAKVELCVSNRFSYILNHCKMKPLLI